jgi:hypothetical protein
MSHIHKIWGIPATIPRFGQREPLNFGLQKTAKFGIFLAAKAKFRRMQIAYSIYPQSICDTLTFTKIA